jgi:hypothetical protein
LLSAKKILPGKAGRIEAKIDTAGLFGGSVQKLISVRTNDPHNPTVTLTVKAVVEPEVEVSPSELFFDNVPVGEEARREVVLTIAPAKQVKILSVESTDPSIGVGLEPAADGSGKKFRLIVIRKSDAKVGYHFGQIKVKTTSRLMPELSIYERGTVPVR